MSYRSTPIAVTGASPAQLMTGRQICTTVSVLEKSLRPKPANWDLVYQKDAAAKEAYRLFYSRRHSVCPLPELHPSQNVQVKLDGEKEWKTPATVISRSQEPRSYLVEMDNGTVTRRNRQHLQAVPEAASPVAHQECAAPIPQQDCSSPVAVSVVPQDLPQSPPSSGSTQRSSLQSTIPWRLTSRGREVKLPLRFRDG